MVESEDKDGNITDKEIDYAFDEDGDSLICLAGYKDQKLSDLSDPSEMEKKTINGQDFYLMEHSGTDVALTEYNNVLYGITCQNLPEGGKSLDDVLNELKFGDEIESVEYSKEVGDISFTIDESVPITEYTLLIQESKDGTILLKDFSWKYESSDDDKYSYKVSYYKDTKIADLVSSDSTYSQVEIAGNRYNTKVSEDSASFAYYTEYNNDTYFIYNKGDDSGLFLSRSDESVSRFDELMQTISFKDGNGEWADLTGVTNIAEDQGEPTEFVPDNTIMYEDDYIKIEANKIYWSPSGTYKDYNRGTTQKYNYYTDAVKIDYTITAKSTTLTWALIMNTEINHISLSTGFNFMNSVESGQLEPNVPQTGTMVFGSETDGVLTEPTQFIADMGYVIGEDDPRSVRIEYYPKGESAESDDRPDVSGLAPVLDQDGIKMYVTYGESDYNDTQTFARFISYIFNDSDDAIYIKSDSTNAKLTSDGDKHITSDIDLVVQPHSADVYNFGVFLDEGDDYSEQYKSGMSFEIPVEISKYTFENENTTEHLSDGVINCALDELD